MKEIERAREMYCNPEKFGFKDSDIKTMKKTLGAMYPDIILSDNDNEMLKETVSYLNTLEETPKLKVIKAWLSNLRFPDNDKETEKLISLAIKALKMYGIFHKGTGKAVAFLKSIQVAEPKTYEELYNSFTDEERKMTDDYYRELFEKHKKENTPMTDEERDAIKRGAMLLKNFNHPDLYELLEKYFPK
jgi:hypothetical protein